MYNTTDLVREIQRISDKERRASNPSGYIHGKVIQESPLKIKTDTNLILDDDFLIVPQRMTDWEVKIEVIDWQTEDKSGGGGYAEFASHRHDIKGVKKIKVLNALKEGDNVILIQQDGGQEFLVYDRESD